jgi:putative transposase
MAWRVLRREPGQPWTGINHKRIQRLWREEGLRRPVRTRKRRRVTPDTAERLRATHPNHVWAIDFQFDETADGRRLKLANIVDEHTREALAMRVGRRCSADDLVTVLDGLVAERGAPAHLRADNGPELIAWGLREWCRLSGTRTRYIEPGSPWENPYVESFNGRVRDELLNLEEFTSLTVAQVVVEAWRIEYNTYRPHSALDGLTPAEYAATWTRTTQPALSWWVDQQPGSRQPRGATSRYSTCSPSTYEQNLWSPAHNIRAPDPQHRLQGGADGHPRGRRRRAAGEVVGLPAGSGKLAAAQRLCPYCPAP